MQMVEDILLAQVRRCQVVVSGGVENSETIVQIHRLGEHRGDVEITAFALAPVPYPIRLLRQEHIGQIGFEAQLGSNVVIERGDKRSLGHKQ